MKLAEALILRADCQKRMAQLKGRLLVNAKVQEGDAPAETPQRPLPDVGRSRMRWRSVMCWRFSGLLTPTTAATFQFVKRMIVSSEHRGASVHLPQDPIFLKPGNMPNLPTQ